MTRRSRCTDAGPSARAVDALAAAEAAGSAALYRTDELLVHILQLGERTGRGELFGELSARLRGVRVCCGDWLRVLGRSTLGIDTAHGMTPCGVLLDSPYAHDERDKRLYREDAAHLSGAARAWALENGDNPALRIVLCGWDGEHAMPPPGGCRSRGSPRAAARTAAASGSGSRRTACQ